MSVTESLTEAQIECYRTKGYIAVEDVISQTELDELDRVVEEFVEASRSVTANDPVYILEDGHRAATPRLARIQSPSKQHAVFERMSRHSAILDCVEALIGPDIRFQGEKLNLKIGDGGSAVEWHQDFAFYPHTHDAMLAVGVALDDCAVDNGCLLMIPGSHREPMLDHHQDDQFVGAIQPSRGEADLTRAEPVEIKAGGISIHHVRTLHGSTPNRSARPRRLLLLQYAAADALPLSGVTDFAAFNSAIVRGQPTYDFRMGDMVARVPHKGEADGGAIFGTQKYADERPLSAR